MFSVALQFTLCISSFSSVPLVSMICRSAVKRQTPRPKHLNQTYSRPAAQWKKITAKLHRVWSNLQHLTPEGWKTSILISHKISFPLKRVASCVSHDQWFCPPWAWLPSRNNICWQTNPELIGNSPRRVTLSKLWNVATLIYCWQLQLKKYGFLKV